MNISESVDSAFQTGFIRYARGSLLIAAFLIFVLPSVPAPLRYAPFALSVIILGLPHGAVDHLVPYKLGRTGRTKSILWVVAAYGIVGALYLVLWVVSPLVGVASFILMTLFHWGQGDVYTGQFYDEGASDVVRWLRLYVHGAFPMIFPLATFPTVYFRVVNYMYSVITGTTVDFAVNLIMRATAGIVVLLPAVVLVFIIWWQNGNTREELAEISVLTIFFAAVPPILAVGIYFCLWHGARHISRLTITSGTRVWSVFKEAVPMTIGAVGLIAGLLVFFGVNSIGELLGLYLIGIAVMTAPHVILVVLMDFEQGVWS